MHPESLALGAVHQTSLACIPWAWFVHKREPKAPVTANWCCKVDRTMKCVQCPSLFLFSYFLLPLINFSIFLLFFSPSLPFPSYYSLSSDLNVGCRG
jgi:hypothetical protein